MKYKNNSLPKVTVIVVGTNEKKWLTNSLKSLVLNDYENVEIVFIDNNSNDGSKEHVEINFPSIKIFKNDKNLGFSGANNIGIKYALENGSDYIFLVNPDTISPSGLINRLVDFMNKNTDFGIIGPIQKTYNNIDELNKWSIQVLENQDKSVFHKWDIKDKTTPRCKNHVDPNVIKHAYVQGSAIFFRNVVFREIGLFEEIFHTYYEETDLCRKARWAGYEIGVLLDIFIQHFGGGESINRPTYTNYYFRRNKYIYLITDPEYGFHEILSISRRWILRDVKSTLKTSKLFKEYIQLANILLWLITHVCTLKKMRKNNIKLYTNLKSFGLTNKSD